MYMLVSSPRACALYMLRAIITCYILATRYRPHIISYHQRISSYIILRRYDA